MENMSVKSHDFDRMTNEQVQAIVRQDYNELRSKYGGPAEVRRPGHPLFGQKVEAARLHLVYEGKLANGKVRAAIIKALKNTSVEVHFK
jgi:hypothetical protein